MHVFKQKLFSGGLAVCFALSSLFSPAIVAAAPDIQSTSITTTTTSIFGYDQYETASKIAQDGWSGTSDYAILAAGMPANLIDALAAGPLAAKLNAPILLTEGNSLNKYAKDQLARLNVKKVFITSGPAVIKQKVIDEVKSLPTITEVKSLGGYDASETSVNIAKEMANQGVKISKVVVTGGAGSDALSVAPIAGAQGMPILYTRGASLSSYVAAYLNGLKANLVKSYVIGGTGVIGDSVKAQIPGTVERYYGYTQYDTNIAVFKQFAGALKNKTTYVANGETLVDALAGAPLAVKNNSLILLTSRTLPEASKKYAQSNLSSNVIGLGGEAVVPANVLRSLAPVEIISQDGSTRGSSDAANLEQLKGILKVTGDKVTLKNVTTDYSIYIQGDNATLENVTVKGTIFLDPGDDGTANLKNVNAVNIVILSGGEHSINLTNVIAQLLDNQSSSPNVHINASGGTKIVRTESSASAIFQAADGSFGIVRITYSSQAPGAAPVVELIGNFTDTIEVGGGVTVTAASGSNISKLAVVTDNQDQTVTLKGNFNTVTIETKANVVLGDKTVVKEMVTKATAKVTVPSTSSIEKLDKGSTDTTTSGSGSVGGQTGNTGGGGGGGGGGDDDDPVIPAAPNVTRDDTLNTVTGMTTAMEYNLDGAGYVAYNENTFSAINFAGNHTLLVRYAAVGSTPASYVTTLTFTENQGTAPAAPSYINSAAVSGTSIHVNWAASATATGYKVFREDQLGTIVQVGNVTGTGFTDTGLAYATPYTYTVIAYNSIGDSLSSGSSRATTFPQGALIVSGVAHGATLNKDVTITAQSQGQTVTIKEASQTDVVAQGVAAKTVTTEGSHTLNITATGGAEPVSLSFTIDKTKPTVTLAGVDDDAQILDDPAGVTLTANYAGVAGVDFLADTKSVLLNGKPYDITQAIKQPGQYTVSASVRDAAGNIGTATKTFSIVWDTTSPAITINNAPADGSTIPDSITPSVTLAGGTNLANYSYTATITGPDGQRTNYSEGDVIPELSAEGKYTISVVALNPSYVDLTSQKTVQFWIDKTKPTISIQGVADDGEYNTSVTPVISLGDNVADQAYLKDNAVVTLTKNGSPLDPLYAIGNTLSDEGTYVLTVTAKDGANNTESFGPIQFKLDKTPPSITVTGVTDGSTYSDTVTMDVVSNEAGSLTVSVEDEDGTPIAPVAGQHYEIDGVEDEVHTYFVVIAAEDSAGNKTSKQLSFSIDKQDVTIVVNGVSEGQFLKNLPTIDFSAYKGTDLVADPTATLNGENFVSGNAMPNDSADGLYTLVVSATDTDVNQTYTKTISFKLDRTEPVVSITSVSKNDVVVDAPLYVKVGDKIKIDATITEGSLLSQSFSIDSTSSSVSGTIPLTAAGGNSFTGTWTVGGGNYNDLVLNVSAKDKAGSSAKVEWSKPVIIDNNRPDVSLITNPGAPDGQNGYFTADNMTVQLQAAAGETITYTFNAGAETQNSTGSVTLNAQPGHNSLTYKVIDQAGNSSDLKTFSFDYDNEKPAAPVVTAPASGTTGRSTTVTITGTALSEAAKVGSTVVVRKAGVEIAEASVAQNGSFSVNGVTLADGVNLLSLIVVDYAGNESLPTDYTLILDSISPVLAVTKVNDTTYKAAVNEDISNLAATFNGIAIAAGSIVGPDAAGAYLITTPQPIVGANALFLSASDLAGNLGTGSLTSSYIAPTVAQNNLQVSGNAAMDIPAGAFSNATQMTVRTGTFSGESSYKLLGETLSFNFSEKPTSEVILKILVGTGLKGVTLFHIDEAGVIAPIPFEPPTTQAAVEALVTGGTMKIDTGYYLTDTGYVWLKTKNFSDYQVALDDDPPEINFTVQDPVVRINKPGKDGGELKLEGTVTDLDPEAKITKIEINKVSYPDLLTGNVTGKDFNIPLNHLGDGMHTVKLTAEDSAENSTTRKKMFNVDATPPEFKKAEIEGYTSKDGDIYVTNSDSVLLNFTLSKNAEVFVNGVSKGNKDGANSLTLNLLSEGNNSFEVKATDAYGNTISQQYTIRKDTTAPSLDIEGVSDGGVYGGDLHIKVTSSGLSPVVSIDGDDSYGTDFTYTASENPGMHTLVATVTDAAGNTTTETITFTMDASIPTLTLSGVTNGGTYTTDQAVSIIAANATQVFVTKLVDGVPQTVIPVNNSVSIVCPEGEQHTYTLVAIAMKITDDGSIRMANQAVTFKIDRKAPTLTAAAAVSQVESSSVQITGTLDEAADIKVYRNDTTLVASLVGSLAGPYTLSVNDLEMGANTLKIVATDKAGLTSTPVELTVNRVVKVTSITASNGKLVLTFSGNGANSLAQADFDLSAKLNGTAVNLANLAYANGVFTFTPIAKAAQEQTLELSLSKSSTTTKLGSIEGSPKTVFISANPAPAAPNVSADDVNNVIVGINNTMEYSLDGGDYVAYSSANAPVFNGNAEVRVRLAPTASFPAGNYKTLVFTANPVKPAKPAVTHNDILNTVSGMAAGMEYNYDSKGYVAYDEAVFNNLSFTGAHTLLVRIAAVGINPPSDAVSLVFTDNLVDKTALQAAIQTAQDKVQADYTPESWATLQDALSAATTVYANTSATATEVSEAISALLEAIAGLDAIDSTAREEFINKITEVYSKLLPDEKASLNSARAKLHDLALDDPEWEDIISPVLTDQLIARFKASEDTPDTEAREVAKAALIRFTKDFCSISYSADRTTLEAALETFRLNNRVTFRTLLGNDFTMDQLYAFLAETQEVLPDVITDDVPGLADIFSGSSPVIKDQMVAWTKVAMHQVALNNPQFSLFETKFAVLGFNANTLVEVQRRLGAVIDLSNEAEKAIVVAAVRSQIQCTVPTQIQAGGSTTFDIKIKGVDTGALTLAGLVDWYSSDETIATLDTSSAKPVITAKKAGTTVISARKLNSPNGTELVHIEVTVTP